jgi:membrane protein
MVISFGFVLLVSLLIDAILSIFKNIISEVLDGSMVYLIASVNMVLSLSIITLIFGLLFKVLPDAKIRWRDLWVGAFITALLFTIGKYLIGLYLGNSDLNSAYGAEGSFVVILFWVYYSTIIFLFGAQLTFEYAFQFGQPIEPDENAVRYKIVEVANSKGEVEPTISDSE